MVRLGGFELYSRWVPLSIRQRASSPLGVVAEKSHAKIAHERRRKSEGRQLAGASLRLPWLNARRLAIVSTNDKKHELNLIVQYVVFLHVYRRLVLSYAFLSF